MDGHSEKMKACQFYAEEMAWCASAGWFFLYKII